MLSVDNIVGKLQRRLGLKRGRSQVGGSQSCKFSTEKNLRVLKILMLFQTFLTIRVFLFPCFAFLYKCIGQEIFLTVFQQRKIKRGDVPLPRRHA